VCASDTAADAKLRSSDRRPQLPCSSDEPAPYSVIRTKPSSGPQWAVRCWTSGGIDFRSFGHNETRDRSLSRESWSGLYWIFALSVRICRLCWSWHHAVVRWCRQRFYAIVLCWRVCIRTTVLWARNHHPFVDRAVLACPEPNYRYIFLEFDVKCTYKWNHSLARESFLQFL